MNRAATSIVLWAIAGILPGALAPAPVHAAETYRSPVALAAGGKFLYVAESAAKRVSVFHTEKNRVTRSFALSERPSGLALAPDGKTLYVTAGGAAGRVHVIEIRKKKIIATLLAGHTPTAPVLSPDGKTLFVCNRFDNDVSVFDLDTMEEAQRIRVTREPVAAAITPDGKRLLVANLLPAGAADANYVSAVVDVIDVASRTRGKAIALPNGSTGLHGICVSPDGAYAYVTHILSRYQLPTTQLERGWMNTNAVSVIQIDGMRWVNTVLLDDLDLGAANPWGVACSPDGKWLCVSHAGSHELSVIDRKRFHEKLAEAEAAGTAANVPNDLSFLVGMRKRYKLLGKGPREIVATDARVFCAEYFSGSIGTVDLGPDPAPAVESWALGKEPPPSIARLGERFFHDATYCFQQWQSCSSCHPGEARVDGLNWDLLNDGMGNPKNAKSLLLAHETPPAMITGIRDSAETAVRAGIRFILFNELPDEHAVSVDAYLKSLTPIPSPRLEHGEMSPAARRGERVFKTAKCSACHSGPYFTDMKDYEVGTGRGREEKTQFDTPTLVEVWRTAPYLHDGRAPSIESVLTTFNENDRHGRTSALTSRELSDLAEYVLSL